MSECFGIMSIPPSASIVSWDVIISNNVVCVTAYKIPQINCRQLTILSIYVLSILGLIAPAQHYHVCFVF